MKYLFIFLIKIYQLLFSPHRGVFRQFYFATPPCMFEESCSDFACRQLKEKGTFQGIKLTTQRIAQCHSFGNK